MLLRVQALMFAMASTVNARYVMYLTGFVIVDLSTVFISFLLFWLVSIRCLIKSARQHDVVPKQHLVSDLTHVNLAFMPSSAFNVAEPPSSWSLFTTVEKVRSQFPPSTSVMISIGGWGDTVGFSQAAATETSRKLFAKNVKAMVDATGADGKFETMVLVY
jgi:GH18 family chitinase